MNTLQKTKRCPAAVLSLLLGLACCLPASAATKSSLRSAIERVRTSAEKSPGIQSVWNNSLELDQLVAELDQDEPNAESMQAAVERLRRLERALDRDRTQRLIGGLKEWLGQNPPPAPVDTPQLDEIPSADTPPEGEPVDVTDSAVAAAAELRDWLERNRLRTWQQLLALDDLIESLESDAPETDSADNLLQFLVEEQQPATRAARIRLRRELEDWLDEQSAPLTNELARLAREQKQTFRQVDDGQLTRLRNETRSAVQRLQRWLDTGTPAKRDGWRNYLKLPSLEANLALGLRPPMRDLVKSYQQFNTGARGLEKKKFRNVRNSLKDYLEVLQFAESNVERLPQQQQRVQNAVNDLERALIGAGPTKEAAWKNYLRWDDLTKFVADSAPDPRDGAAILRQLDADEPGLELAPFRHLQRELQKRFELLQLGRSASNVDRYRRQMERLARAIDNYAADPTSLVAAEVSDLLFWLRRTGYAPDLVARVKSTSYQPNLRVVVDGGLLVDSIADTRNEAIPVNRCFEGAHVTGVACTAANFEGRLVPAADQIAIDILVRGSTITRATGRQRKVSVYTQGLTDVQGSKRIFMNVDRIASTPAVATASTRQQIRGVNVNRRCGKQLIGRFACRRAQKTTPKAECMTNREAENTMVRRLDSETDQLLADANQRLQERQQELRDRGVFPDEVSLSSTSQNVYVFAKTASEEYLAAPYNPPTATISDGQMLAQLHDSLINNTLCKSFGGLYLDNELLVEMMREAELEVPDELLPKAERKKQAVDNEAAGENAAPAEEDGDENVNDDDEPDAWTMTFDDLFPVVVRFDGSGVRVAIRGREFSNEEQEIKELIEISAAYDVDLLPEGKIGATRRGKIEVDFVNTPGRLSGAQLSYKTFLLRKMKPLFRENFTSDDLPTTGEMGDLLNAIEPIRLGFHRGWLTTEMKVDAEAMQSLMPMAK